jgi:hypothetical protein
MNLCTRLKGKILKGAMPWHHRYIGNPLITWLLNRFYKVGVSDSQCRYIKTIYTYEYRQM